jgi:hypothetical protein
VHSVRQQKGFRTGRWVYPKTCTYTRHLCLPRLLPPTLLCTMRSCGQVRSGSKVRRSWTKILSSPLTFQLGLTLINPAWLPALGKTLCTFSKPFKDKAGQMMVTPKFGPDGWELPPVKADNTMDNNLIV